ncbi:fibronectin type III domain-containing protein [Actinoplanes sp. NPDC049118]|uniref:fibronectin type III domain-containing protein n=1 Tax=Actinoplanes sp. NPDC049118 TaxID=3155769 RepID=UPI003411361C
MQVAAPSSPALADLPAGGMTAPDVSAMFGTYGDTSGRWNGGDATASVPLPDGRLVWLFSDTFLGPINPDGSRPRNTPMVHNAMVVQSGDQILETRHGGTTAAPTSLVGADTDGQNDSAGYWVGDGTVEGTSLRVLFNHYRRTGTGSLDVALTGTWLATFALPSLTLQSLTDLNKGTRVTWGSTIVESTDFTYIYGTEFATDGTKFMHLARVPAGGISGAWQYWTGSAWTSQLNDSGRIMSGVGTSYGLQQIGGQYVLITMDTNLVFNPTVVAYTASSPAGPFTGPQIVHTAPESRAGVIVYETRIHAALARPGKILFSYNVNDLTDDGNYNDARSYRPRFVEVAWPLPAPDPATVPAAPADLAGTVDDQGIVKLSWSASASATRYWLYQQDLTAGQTHIARVPDNLTGTSIELPGLKNGHQYRFAVSAANASGEGPRSAPATVTATVPKPPAPGNVNAVTDAAGRVTVSWAALPNAWSYQVFYRDVTAGEAAFQEQAKVDWSQTSQGLDWLTNGHEYEFYVTAENGGGQSDPSTKVRVAVRYDVSAAPTGLSAAAKPDGSVLLRWSAPAPGLWYYIYQRDVTAGEAEFTQLGIPVTAGTEMTAGGLTHGHSYEFAVAAINGAGESPRSTVVTAASTYPAPAAPAGLKATAAPGEVKLTWTDSGEDYWHWVYMRDVTAGETEFAKLEYPASEASTFTAGYLTNGHTYEFKIAAIGQGSVVGPLSAAVQATPRAAVPAAPTNVAAAANSDGTIGVTWTAPAAGLFYVVSFRDATAGQDWQRAQYPTEGTKFTAGYLTAGHRYEFKVQASSDGGESPASDVVSATSKISPPAAPTGLTGSTDGDGRIDLNWDAPAPNLYYYAYYRNVTEGGAFVRTVYPSDKLNVTLGGLKNNHVYEFKVTAANGSGEGPASATIRVTSKGGLPLPPTITSAVAGDGKATVRWTASATANVYYWVEYRPTGGTWKRPASPVSTCCVSDVGFLSNGTTYEFRVRSTNNIGDSIASEVKTAKPMPPLPAAPSGLTPTPGDGKVTLRWTASSTPNVFYQLEYRTSGGSWQRIKDPISTCCTFVAGYLTNNTVYEFRLRATNAAGESGYTGTVTARPMPPTPQAPSGLSVTASLGEASLRWTASPTPNVYYWVEFRTPGGAWQRGKAPDTTCCTAKAGYLTASAYEFRVRATNAAGDSTPSNVVSVTMPLPPAPTGISSVPNGPYGVKVTWNAVPGADSYIVYHGVSGSMISIPSLKPLELPVLGGNKTTFTGGYLTQVGIHFWAVAAVKNGRVGPKSGMDTMSPLMENSLYREARWRYFNGPAPGQHTKGFIPVKKASVDSGIVVARAYIGDKGAYIPISDGRSESSSGPFASARIHVAWDTDRGLLGALAQPSCVLIACSSALPISFRYSGATDTQSTPSNYVWTDATGDDALRFHWKATNSDTNNLWRLGWHIDTEVNLAKGSGTNMSASLRTDHFPSYEVIQYPHYSTNGYPAFDTLAECGQYQIVGLSDSPSERRSC